MSWMSSADGLMKKKKDAERGLQNFGKKIGDAIRNYKRPQGSLKARQAAWYEGGKGKFPTE